MTRYILAGLVSVALVAMLAIESSARGPSGGGGRGGGGGGMSRGGGHGGGRSPSYGDSSAGRSPSMSRTPSRGSGGISSGTSRPGSSASPGGRRPDDAGSSRPGGSRPGGSIGSPSTGSRPSGSAFERPEGSTRPSPGGERGPGSRGPTDQQLGGFLDLPRDRDIGGRGSVVDRRQQQPGGPGFRGPGEGDRVTERRDHVPDRRQEPLDNRRERLNNRGDVVRDQARDQRDVFSDQWRERHPHQAHNRWQYSTRHPANYWWRRGTWAGVTGWVASSWAEPVYYDYGNTIVYQDGGVYQDGDEVASAEQYAQQAQQIAQMPVETDPEEAEWMPLGTFAMVREKDTKATMFLQLAVSKEGIITGTYFNTTSDSAQPIEGHVDKESQRAAWWIGDNQNNILETGIYNLTQDETPLLVHFGSEQTQTWLLVRLEESTEGVSDEQ